jgi:hypothetical protein
VHLVPHLRGGTFHAVLKVYVGIVPPTRPRLPNEIASRLDPFIIRTPCLAELKGLLISLCRRHNLSKSEVALIDVHGWCRNLHSKLGPGVNGLRKAHAPSSQENWEERLELATKRRPSQKLTLG